MAEPIGYGESGTRALPERELELLRALERKVLWLSSWMIHHANHIRPSRDRVEGRGASGLLRLGGDPDDRAVLPRPAPGGSRRGQAAMPVRSITPFNICWAISGWSV